MANAAIYLPVEEVDLRQVFPQAKTDKSLFRKASYFDVELNGEVVRFNVMPKHEVPGHLNGLRGYLTSLPDEATRKSHAAMYAQQMRTVLGLSAPSEFDENPAVWQSLFQIADRFDGLVFAYNSLVLANGAVLVGPLRESEDDGP
jgi:hypothetical protein